MRPYTNNLPKCLLPVGGKTIIDWIVGDTRQLAPTETIFITGYKAEASPPYTSDDEPLLIILGDTLFDADLRRLASESENVLYTYKVQDPRRFGVAVTSENGRSPAGAGGGLSRHEFILSAVEGPEGRAHLTSGPPGPSGFHP